MILHHIGEDIEHSKDVIGQFEEGLAYQTIDVFGVFEGCILGIPNSKEGFGTKSDALASAMKGFEQPRDLSGLIEEGLAHYKESLLVSV